MAQAAKKIEEDISVKDITGEKESFAALLEESLKGMDSFEGSVVEGTVIAVDDDAVTVDVGLKSEGRIPLREFGLAGSKPEINVGDKVEVFVERVESASGEALLSRDKARREEAWIKLEKLYKAEERVSGVIFGRVKGGFTVDLDGAVAFLPGSQVDIRPVRDITPLMGTPQPFQILKMDRARGNIVVSRRAILEESREEARSELVATIKEGQVLQGIVKNITNYGAFIDLGGVDGLLHVTDISWKRINHPSEVLHVGQTVEVQVVKFNEETQRISLGMKQLGDDPWQAVEDKFKVGEKMKGIVTNITDYGAFIELEEGIEGLVHVSEMSWTKKNIPPGKIVSTSQEVDVMVLEVDKSKRRISLGLKQCMDNPWDAFAQKAKVGDKITGEIKNITEFGLFVEIGPEIDGMVHMSDLSWDKTGEEAIKDHTKGETIEVKVLEIQPEKERVALGVKQLEDDPFSEALSGIGKGDVVTCTVSEVTDGTVNVTVNETVSGIIKKIDLSRERSEQRPDRFAVGEKVDAKIMKIDRANRSLMLSIKAREIEEDKEAMAEFGSSDSGASLGDILGAALQQKEGAKSEDEPKKETKKKASTAKKKTEEVKEEKAEEKKKPAAKKKAPAKKAAAKKETKKKEEK